MVRVKILEWQWKDSVGKIMDDRRVEEVLEWYLRGCKWLKERPQSRLVDEMIKVCEMTWMRVADRITETNGNVLERLSSKVDGE